VGKRLVDPEGIFLQLVKKTCNYVHNVTLINNMHCSLVKSTFQQCTPAYQIAKTSSGNSKLIRQTTTVANGFLSGMNVSLCIFLGAPLISVN